MEPIFVLQSRKMLIKIGLNCGRANIYALTRLTQWYIVYSAYVARPNTKLQLVEAVPLGSFS